MVGDLELDNEKFENVILWRFLHAEEGNRSLAIQRRIPQEHSDDYDYETLLMILQADLVPGYVDEDPENVFDVQGSLCDDPLDGDIEHPLPKVGVRYTYVKARFTLYGYNQHAA